MAPSPAAGKTGDAPSTPTRAGKKPSSNTTSKLGQEQKPSPSPKAPKTSTPSKPSKTPSKGTPSKDVPAKPTPKSAKSAAKPAASKAKKTAEDKKPEDSPKLPPRPKEADPADADPKEAAEGVGSKVQMEDNETEEESPEGKISQAGNETGNEETNDESSAVSTSGVGDTGELEEQAPEPETSDVEDTAGGAQEDIEDTADDAGDDEGDDEGDETEDTVEGVKKSGQGILGGAKDLAGKADAAKGLAGKGQEATNGDIPDAGDAAEGAKDTAGDAAEGTKDAAGDAVNGVKESAEDATGQEIPTPDLSILKGLEVGEGGEILGQDGSSLGKVVEGDPEELAGMTVGDDGEILDEDGDLVGRVEVLPEKAEELANGVKDTAEDAAPELPDVSILKGLAVTKTGDILDDEGNFVGQVADGDHEELEGKTVNEKGEIVDDEGNVLGSAKVIPEALNSSLAGDLKDKVPELPGLDVLNGLEVNEAGEILDQDGNTLGKIAEGDPEQLAGKTVNEKGDILDEEGEVIGKAEVVPGDAANKLTEAADGVKDQLPGLEVLQGLEVKESGDILDADGNPLGKVAEGDPEELAGKLINEKGEILDEDGEVIGKAEVVPGDAANKLKEGAELPILSILKGLKVNKKGNVLDEEGEQIGKLTEGEPKETAGKTINDNGEILDKKGNVIGKVEVVPGEAADNALAVLKEQLADAAPETPELPDISTLKGLKVNKKGEVLNDEGEPVGKLTEGELSDVTGKEINEKGEILDDEGNVIGKVETIAEGAGPELPPLSVLEGLTCNKAGKIVNDEGVPVGQLIEGDPKKLSKLGLTCDDQGQFWDSKGHVLGKAETIAVEEKEEEAPFAHLEGLIVVKGGKVEDENGNVVGQIVEGDPKKLIGRRVDEDGDVIDKNGNVTGHAERWEEPEEEELDISILEGKAVNKMGNVIGDEGVPIGRLIQGDAKKLAGKTCDDQGQIWDGHGKVVGKCEVIPLAEREGKPEGPFAGLEGLIVNKEGKVEDENSNVVGEIVEGNPKKLVGRAVDEDGDIMDKYGNVAGHAEPIEEPEEVPADLSVLAGKVVNKQGNVIGDEGVPIGRLVEGDAKQLAGKKCDGEGQLWNDQGKVIGRCELIPEDQREAKPEGPFAGLEGLVVTKEGKVEDESGNVVGEVVEGVAKRLVGHSVDEDGDITDKYGNVKGHAIPWEAPEEEPEDLSSLAGCVVNKVGNVVDSNGTVIGRISQGDPKAMAGKKVDGEGQIWNDAGKVIGKAILIPGDERDEKSEGPFAGWENLVVAKGGVVQDPSGQIVGKLTNGDEKMLVGRSVDEDGDVLDKNGNVLGHAERWEPEEKKRDINPMAGRKVNREGEVRDEDGNVIGKLTAGNLQSLIGKEIDDNGYVVDNDGNKVGECTLIENLQDEGPTEEELAEQKKLEEDKELANKMSNILQQTLENIQPVCKMITEHMEKADRTPKDELDEEELVQAVKPLIEEGGRILQECNGALRGLDPDGRIAANAKAKAAQREATPEEYRLADLLKELTTTVTKTIDDARKKLNDMPHAKKGLNPLWGLLTEPLFQIIAAVGLLLSGVLGLVGKLLNGLGLGGLVNGLLGGLGIDKLLGGLGLGAIGDSLGLGGGKKKK
ncbi:MAG: hypothetical protein M1819_001891 [Sarea resinae]|nr:MAG: hypothetical protein M1819_001891 [Sarea resinae]